MREIRNVHIIFCGQSEEKRPLGRPRRRWEDNSQIYLTKIVLEGVDWIFMAQDRDHCKYDNETSVFINCGMPLSVHELFSLFMNKM
jgi:hypothetical protein